MSETAALLRRQIDHDLEVIAKNLEDKYIDYIPLPRISDNQNVIGQLESLTEKIKDKLNVTEKIVNDMNVSNVGSKAKELRSELTRMYEWRSVIEQLCLIETNITSLLTDDEKDSSDLAKKADMITECYENLNEIAQENTGSLRIERPRSALNSAINNAASFLRARLMESYEQFVSFRDDSKGPKGSKIMMITQMRSKLDMSTVFSAMKKMHYFDDHVKKLTRIILNDFCQVLVEERGDVQAGEYIKLDTTQYSFQVTLFKTKSLKRGPDVVFEMLTNFFVTLNEALHGIEVVGETLSLTIGKMIQEDLMAMILKHSICSAVPMIDQDNAAFNQVMERAELFRAKMIELGIWNERVASFLKYSEENSRVVIDRKCLTALSTAKTLICQPFLKLVEVGAGLEHDNEVADDFMEAFGQPPPDLRVGEHTYPKFYQLMKCQVSDWIVEFVNLVEQLLQEAVTADNEMKCGRLALTASNILSLFLIVSPKHHQTVISSVPLAAAVFYNNAYYVCHRLMMLPFTILKNVSKKDDKNYSHFHSILSDNVWPLRKMAADCLEMMLLDCRRQISTILSNRQLFVDLVSLDHQKLCQRTILKCTMLLESISDVWKTVLSETTYCNALGNLVSFFLNDICSMLIEAEDIRTPDAENAAIELTAMLKKLEKLFIVRGFTRIHDQSVCGKEFFRAKELIFCLDGSLKSIGDRWCDAKGPLAEWMTAAEVRSLIRALFQNTEQRKHLIESI